MPSSRTPPCVWLEWFFFGEFRQSYCIDVEPKAGIEPATRALRMRCSTSELLRREARKPWEAEYRSQPGVVIFFLSQRPKSELRLRAFLHPDTRQIRAKKNHGSIDTMRAGEVVSGDAPSNHRSICRSDWRPRSAAYIRTRYGGTCGSSSRTYSCRIHPLCPSTSTLLFFPLIHDVFFQERPRQRCRNQRLHQVFP